MNPRRVHELMSSHFPPVDSVTLDWQNIKDRDGLLVESLKALIRQYITASEVLVEVNQESCVYFPVDDAIKFIGERIGQGQIKVTDRGFQGFVVIATNGTAAGWSLTPDIQLVPDSQSDDAAAS